MNNINTKYTSSASKNADINRNKIFMNKLLSAFSFLIIIAAIACNTTEQKNTSEEFYKSSDLTAVNSFTSGEEGPAQYTFILRCQLKVF
jgi:hypothetical protein